jgi:aryl-alcohol dehydrogenase-like predicted oxidoreductase
MPGFPERVTLGRSGLRVSKLGLGSSFGAPAASYLEAFERGANYFYWGSLRRSGMGDAIREIARRRREELVVVVQSYARLAGVVRRSTESALRRLGLDHADVLLLGWYNHAPRPALVEAAQALRERGLVRHVALSGHRRALFPELLDDPTWDVWHLRYNAVHRGAELEVFPKLIGREAGARPGVVTYTTTRWGHLCDPARTPPGEPTPTGTDCYRFALSHPQVDCCLAGPDDAEQMRQALAALDLGPLDADALAWMHRVGDHIYGRDRTSGLRDDGV